MQIKGPSGDYQSKYTLAKTLSAARPVTRPMARLDEIAEGVSSVLASSQMPEPQFLDMMDQSPGEVTFLIRAVVDACERRGVPLSKIRVGQTLGSNAKRALGPEPLKYEGIAAELVEDLERRIEFYRFPTSSDAG